MSFSVGTVGLAPVPTTETSVSAPTTVSCIVAAEVPKPAAKESTEPTARKEYQPKLPPKWLTTETRHLIAEAISGRYRDVCKQCQLQAPTKRLRVHVRQHFTRHFCHAVLIESPGIQWETTNGVTTATASMVDPTARFMRSTGTATCRSVQPSAGKSQNPSRPACQTSGQGNSQITEGLNAGDFLLQLTDGHHHLLMPGPRY